MELEASLFDLRQVVHGSLVMLKERAANHGIHLKAEIGEGVDKLFADESKIKQILFNLLSNAVKFTPDKGSVGIKVAVVRDEIQIAVWDTGIGIPKSEQDKLFKEFHRVQSSLSATVEGTGLGLTLTRKFVELHGGLVWMESSPGSGSVFTIALPNQKWNEDTMFLSPPQNDPDPLEADTRHEEDAQVLVVEPDAGVADLLTRHLNEAGYTVAVACDYEEGWEKLKAQPLRVVVLDILRTQTSRVSFLNRLKEAPETKDLPLILVSSLEGEEMVEGASGTERLANLDPKLLIEQLGASMGICPSLLISSNSLS